MNELLQIFMPALIALFCTCWIYPYILKVAKIKNIVDNPDARKLQRIPIPVLGGFTVVFGILTGIMSANLFGNFNGIFPIFSAIIFMNLLVVLCWYCAYKFGLSINMQLYIVIALGVLFTFILYPIVDSQTGKNTAISRFLRRIGSLSHKSRSKFWISMQKIVDISVVKQIQEPQD